MGIVEELVKARESFERREWTTAYRQLVAVDPADLTGDDLMSLATAAHLVGERDTCIRALQRAHKIHLESGDNKAAAMCACWLATVLVASGDTTVGGGWVARAKRLLEDEPEDIVERGYLLTQEMFHCIDQGAFQDAHALAVRITELGRRFHDPDLIAHGLQSQGRFLLYAGQVREGLSLLDEAMVGVAASEVSPIVAGMIYCSVIEACQEISDIARVTQWASALTKWCDAQPDLIPFTGQCAVHRGQIMRHRGAFSLAIEEFALAERRFAEEGTPAAGLALSERGDVLRILGEYADAKAAYDMATDSGHDPQPGRALLWLAQGRADNAAATVRRLLAEAPDPVHRSHLLPAAVEIHLAVDDLDAARSATEELSRIAESFGCTALLAMAAYARAGVRLAAREPEEAISEARKARQLWSSLEALYEAARSRVLVGRGLLDLGDEESATVELRAACRTFDEIGAMPCLRAAERMLRPQSSGGLTNREIEVLRMVASGQSNQEIAAALVLSEKTVARHLSNIFVKIGVPSRTAAAAYAYKHQLV